MSFGSFLLFTYKKKELLVTRCFSKAREKDAKKNYSSSVRRSSGVIKYQKLSLKDSSAV